MSNKKKDDAEHSKFWLGKGFDIDSELSQMDLLRLASYRRAIANFVMILTGKNIPVKFSEGGDSFTNGQQVRIGGELTKGYIDSTVGLALHEGSHIVKSDFNMVHNVWQNIPQSVYNAGEGKLSKNDIAEFTKLMFNYVEDCFVDDWAYKIAPGYRGYYSSLYERYFDNPKVLKALASKSYRNKTLKNYQFRILNIANPKADLGALPKLKEISKLLDLKNISRLKDHSDRLDVAISIVLLVLNDLTKEAEKKSGQSNKGDEPSQKNDSSGQSSSSNENEEKNDENKISSSENKKEDSGDQSNGPSNDEDDIDDLLGGKNGESEKLEDITEKQKELAGSAEIPNEELSENEIKDIEKAIQEQADLTNNELNRKQISATLAKRLSTMENSGVTVKPVGGEDGIPKVDCIMVSNMTKELMEDDSFPYTSKISIAKNINEDAVKAGVSLGTILGRRLQIRNDARITHFSRLPKGKLEKRLIAELGFGSERVFYQTSVDEYKKAHLHITVDASTSMQLKWKRTLTTVVAIAKAGSMVNNLDVVVSFRSGVIISHEEVPYIVVAYDSRKDKFSKIAQLFPNLMANGSTPEGLSFEAILDVIPPATPDVNSFFVNLSDGEPYFSNKDIKYHGLKAWNHTKKQVEKIRSVGVEVMSYFLEEKAPISTLRTMANVIAFKKMYGLDAYVIDVDNVTEIAHSLNKKFLEKVG